MGINQEHAVISIICAIIYFLTLTDLCIISSENLPNVDIQITKNPTRKQKFSCKLSPEGGRTLPQPPPLSSVPAFVCIYISLVLFGSHEAASDHETNGNLNVWQAGLNSKYSKMIVSIFHFISNLKFLPTVAPSVMKSMADDITRSFTKMKQN